MKEDSLSLSLHCLLLHSRRSDYFGVHHLKAHGQFARSRFPAYRSCRYATPGAIQTDRKSRGASRDQKTPPPPPKVEKAKEPKPFAKSEIIQPKPTPPPAAFPKEEPVKPVETKPTESTKSEPTPPLAPTGRAEGGGSEAGAGDLFAKGDTAVVPGSGTAGGGGGTANSGLGSGSGAPGLPASPLRTNREAKPLQTVRAAYPPMALRMGMEGDVTLRIEVDADGKVIKVEIIKSGGGWFRRRSAEGSEAVPLRARPKRRQERPRRVHLHLSLSAAKIDNVGYDL